MHEFPSVHACRRRLSAVGFSNAGGLSRGTALIVGMFDPNMNQTYGSVWAGENHSFFRIVALKNDRARRYNKSAIPPGRRPLWHLRARGQNLKLLFDPFIDQIGG